MRLIFVTDIHHAFNSVADFLSRTEADVTILGGDLVSRAFSRYETAWRFMELQQILEGHRIKVGKEASLYEVALHVRKTTHDHTLRNHAGQYVRLADQAERFLQRSYDRLDRIFGQFPHHNIYVLPGNYDMDFRNTNLKERNLHLETITSDGWRFSGYGGAQIRTPGMPDHLQVSFREEMTPKGIRSEALTFFRKVCTRILVHHEPPYGSFDLVAGTGYTGSLGVRKYLDESPARIVLSGHYHENWGGAVRRPVNLRLIKGVENLLLEKERFRKEVERGLKDYLEILVSSVRHVSSFEKYKSRLRERRRSSTPPYQGRGRLLNGSPPCRTTGRVIQRV